MSRVGRRRCAKNVLDETADGVQLYGDLFFGPEAVGDLKARKDEMVARAAEKLDC
jgi:hypothetical protein